MCLHRCSDKGRWSGWTCSATGTSGWSSDSTRSASHLNCLTRNVLYIFYFRNVYKASTSAVAPLSPGCSVSLPSSLYTWSDKANRIAQVFDCTRTGLPWTHCLQLHLSGWFCMKRSQQFSTELQLYLISMSQQAGQDTTRPFIVPCTMWQIDSLRFRVGLQWLPLSQLLKKGAMGINYCCARQFLREEN